MTATEHLNMPVFGLCTADGESVLLVKVDDVFFFDFFEDGWHEMKDGGISHLTDLINLRQWHRLSLRIGICARMKVVHVSSKSGGLKRGIGCNQLGTHWECKNVSVNWKSATSFKEPPLGVTERGEA